MADNNELELRRENRREMMLKGNILKILPIVALPMVISMLIDTFYNLADTYFVSQLGTAATAAVGVNNSLMFFIRSVGLGFGMGASSYMSRLLGAGKGDKASKVASTTLFTALGFSLSLALIAFCFRGSLVMLLGATETSKAHAISYATFILFAAPLTAGEICLSHFLRSEGSTRFSMIGMVSGCGVNLILDPIFIFVFNFGVAGAAAATALSKLVSFCVLLIPFLRGKSLTKLSFKLFSPSREIYAEVARMGIPAFLRGTVMSFAHVVTNKIAGSYSDSVLAAVSVSNRITMFIGSAIMGFGQGFSPIAGYCYGAKYYRRVRSAFWTTSAIGLGICVVFGTILYIFSPQIVGLFTKTDNEIINVGAYMVRVQIIVLPAHIWGMIINQIFNALGKPVGAAIIGLSRQVICFIPCLIILNILMGVEGLKIAQAVADILSMAIAVPYLISILRFLKKKELQDGAPEDALPVKS